MDHPRTVGTGGGRPSVLALAGAYAAVYLLWGTNYLALRWAVGEIPPFAMMAARSLLAGSVLYAWGRRIDGERPTPAQWRAAAAIGTALFLGGHGGLSWGIQRVPSGVAAVVFATLPLWMILLEAARRRTVPEPRARVAMALGLAGVAVLMGRGAWVASEIDPVGLAAVLGASIAWAAGSLATREAPRPSSTALATGLWLLAGAAGLGFASLLRGELAGFAPAAVSARGILGFAYALIIGSLVGFASYVWLLRVQPLERVAPYGFVNPLVAVLVGWAVGGEALGPRLILSTALVVGAVAAVVRVPAGTRPGNERAGLAAGLSALRPAGPAPGKENLG